MVLVQGRVDEMRDHGQRQSSSSERMFTDSIFVFQSRDDFLLLEDKEFRQMEELFHSQYLTRFLRFSIVFEELGFAEPDTFLCKFEIVRQVDVMNIESISPRQGHSC